MTHNDTWYLAPVELRGYYVHKSVPRAGAHKR